MQERSALATASERKLRVALLTQLMELWDGRTISFVRGALLYILNYCRFVWVFEKKFGMLEQIIHGLPARHSQLRQEVLW
jgi:hypothetical protein